jgi:FecR protein
MRHPALKLCWLGLCLALSLFVIVSDVAVAQDTTPPPPPPDEQGPSIQQPPPENNVRAVRLSNVQGTVQVLSGGSVDFSQAELNMPVVQGMKLVTSANGRVEVQFEDGSVARVTPNSSITLAQLSRNADGSTVTVVEADSGLTYYELNGRAGQYAVHFGQENVVPLDSSIFRVDLDNPSAEVAVTHGSVHITDNQNLAVDVHTNQTVRFDAQNADEYQLLQSVAANTWDQWNSDRDEALAELDDNATAARASTGNPDDPAWSDLDANGDWYNVPGYGTGWAPSGVGQDWDPYGAGSWGYYDNVGYTWISAYSWGWWPYHCGGWNWFDGFGWMWFPGNCGWGGVGFGWYPYGVIWQMPPGYRPPLRPQPIRHPGLGHIPSQPVIAINRGPQFTQQLLTAGGVKPAPRVFQYDGENIAPIEASIHTHQGGPLGEGFTSTVERTNPDVMMRGAYGGTGYRPSSSAPSSAYQPSRSYTPPPSRPEPSGGDRVSAPAPEYHSSPPPAAAPAPASHSPH